MGNACRQGKWVLKGPLSPVVGEKAVPEATTPGKVPSASPGQKRRLPTWLPPESLKGASHAAPVLPAAHTTAAPAQRACQPQPQDPSNKSQPSLLPSHDRRYRLASRTLLLKGAAGVPPVSPSCSSLTQEEPQPTSNSQGPAASAGGRVSACPPGKGAMAVSALSFQQEDKQGQQAPAGAHPDGGGKMLDPAVLQQVADDLWDWEAPPAEVAPGKRRKAASRGGGGSGGGSGGEERAPSGPCDAKRAPTGGGAGCPSGVRKAASAPAVTAVAGQPLPAEHDGSLLEAAGGLGGDPGGGMCVPGGPLDLQDHNSDTHLQVPARIARHLRAYQVEGITFLFKHYVAGLGAILADDMGLGKTVQAIGFIAAVLGGQRGQRRAPAATTDPFSLQQPQQQVTGQGETGPVLVVCPLTLMDNWLREFSTWSDIKVAKYHGPSAAAALAELVGGGVQVLLTTYDMLRCKAAQLGRLGFSLVIADEVHKLKNQRSATYAAAASLPTTLRYGLTGTPMQNRYEELWCLCDWAVPNCLGPQKSFKENYQKPIQLGQRVGASRFEIARARQCNTELTQRLQRMMLRRTKRLIADQLPTKTDNVVFCQLRPRQREAYKRTLASPDLQALVRAKEECDCGSGETRGACCHSHVAASAGGVLWPYYHCCTCQDPGCKFHKPNGCEGPRVLCPYCLILPALSLLRKISNHLGLLTPDPALAATDPRQCEYSMAVAKMVLGSGVQEVSLGPAAAPGLALGSSAHCGKMAALEQLLRLWHGNSDKVLLFSHSVRMLDILERFVTLQGYDYVRLDGSTPEKQRLVLVDQFNTRPSLFIFLISTTAGGLGLNLVGANKVVIFDPSWNPAHDLQAQDRAFRLGQRRDVGVYRLVSTGTLEEAVYRRQIYKQQQANMSVAGAREKRFFKGVQDDKQHVGELWGLANLLRFCADPQHVEIKEIISGQGATPPGADIAAGAPREERRTGQQEQEQVVVAAVGDAASASCRGGGGSGKLEIVQMDALLGEDNDAEQQEGDDLGDVGAWGVGNCSAADTGLLDAGKKREETEALEAGPNDECDEAGIEAGGAEQQQPQQQHDDGRSRTAIQVRAAVKAPELLSGGAEEDEGLGQLALELLAHEQQQLLGVSPMKQWRAGSPREVVGGGSANHRGPGAGSGPSAISQGTDMMLTELQQQGTVLHMHRHDQLMGEASQGGSAASCILEQERQRQQLGRMAEVAGRLVKSLACQAPKSGARQGSTTAGGDGGRKRAVPGPQLLVQTRMKPVHLNPLPLGVATEGGDDATDLKPGVRERGLEGILFVSQEVQQHCPALASLAAFLKQPLTEVAAVWGALGREERHVFVQQYGGWVASNCKK